MLKQIETDLVNLLQVKPKRLAHVYGVRNTAISFGKKYGLDLEKLELAALLHDMTKYYSYEQNVKIVKENFENSMEILKGFNKHILHAFTARVYAQKKYGITDLDVLDAIENHTVGKPAMTMYEKIIFLSDYIEPNRTYDSCVKVRELAKENLDLAVFTAINDSIMFYENLNDNIPQIAYQAREYYKQVLEEQ